MGNTVQIPRTILCTADGYIRDSCAVHFHFMSTQQSALSHLICLFYFFPLCSFFGFLHLLPFTLHYAILLDLLVLPPRFFIVWFLLLSSTQNECATHVEKCRNRKSQGAHRPHSMQYIYINLGTRIKLRAIFCCVVFILLFFSCLRASASLWINWTNGVSFVRIETILINSDFLSCCLIN